MRAFVRTHWRLFAAAAGFSLVINLALLLPSLYMLQVFDRVLATRSLETLALLTLVTGAGLVLMTVLDALRARLLALLGSLFERSVGAPLLEQGLQRTGSAGAQPFALRDVGALRGFLGGVGIVALFDAPWMFVYVGVIFLFSPVLGGLALASALLLLGLALVNERCTRASLDRVGQRARESGHFVESALREAEVVRALGMAPALTARWQQHGAGLQHEQLGLQRVSGLVAAATKGSRQAVQVLMMAAAAWLVIEQRATPGVMIAVTVILGRALAPLELLIGQWKPLVEARNAARRIAALQAEAPPARFGGLPVPTGALSLQHVSVVPPGADQPVLKDVCLEVAAGEVLAVVGPSGSGKSTLARVVLGLQPPSTGHVRLDGADLAQWDPARLGAYLGYLPQQVGLFAGRVADNICRFAAGDTAAAAVRAAERAHVHAAMVRLPRGYDTPVGEAGTGLSGGQRQLVGLARALYGEPRLVVLDEPNASLDADGEAALRRAIEGLRAAGCTVVLVTQRTQILSVADRIAVLRDGRLERIGIRQDAEHPSAVPTHGVPVLKPAPGRPA